MVRCSSCASAVRDGSRFCPSCGAAIKTPTSTPTETTGRTAADEGSASTARELSLTRFLPGTVLAGRYRIVCLLGRGGMGEVYRADDLKLGQPVALKFLPEAVERDPTRLDRFLNEVRTALKVTHPNVCRVHDVGEVASGPAAGSGRKARHYISMEYVDGEDLASLLRRIGRLPRDKAVQIARQLCVGLAAAHEEGILHRDLKPANVMVDGRGRAKIADFGLASMAREVHGEEARAGTPLYMSPEQLAGREATARSDLYALGLVLYELFTGRRAFEAATPEELLRLERESTPTNPSSHVEGLDAAVERAILRCLEREAENRPGSALAVAAALPGGDPLAAALAAGETPSPEMVAAAGGSGALRPVVAAALLAAAALGLALDLATPRRWLQREVPLAKSPEALVEHARDVVRLAGYEDAPADSAHGFRTDQWYLESVQELPAASRWDDLATVRPPPVRFWYRQSPRLLLPANPSAIVSLDDPPFVVSGMVTVDLDPAGRLLTLLAVPPQRLDPGETVAEPDWSALFDRAGLDYASFAETETVWTPPVECDVLRAWTGAYPEQPDRPIRVEAGAYRGKPVRFEIITPWERAYRMGPEPRSSGTADARSAQIGVETWIFVTLLLVLVVAGLSVARRNLRLGKGDRRGAFRTAVAIFVIALAMDVLVVHHVPHMAEIFYIVLQTSGATLLAFVTWSFYVALEPYVRRFWPEALISWTRLLSGRVRDPRIGRDILIGGAAYGLESVLERLTLAMPRLPPLDMQGVYALAHWKSALGLLGGVLFGSFTTVIPMLFLLLLLRVLLRRQWVAAAVFVALGAALMLPLTLGSGGPDAGLIVATLAIAGTVAYSALWAFVAMRFGLLALLSMHTFKQCAIFSRLVVDRSAWYAEAALPFLLVFVGLALYAFHTSLAGRPLLAEERM